MVEIVQGVGYRNDCLLIGPMDLWKMFLLSTFEWETTMLQWILVCQRFNDDEHLNGWTVQKFVVLVLVLPNKCLVV